MNDCIIIKENFCDQIDEVRQSALTAGFGTLTPANTEMGSKKYEGMCFQGRHDLLVRCIVGAIGRPVFPGAMFFRATKPDTEKAYIHSDRGHGDWTCIVYMSKHERVAEGISGTGFFRHKRTGWLEMPTPEQLKAGGVLHMMDECMQAGKPEEWEPTDFVAGLYNRALIFKAPLFHQRFPKHGIGDGTDETARMVWVCHFYV